MIYPLILGSFVQMSNMSFVAQGTSYKCCSKIVFQFSSYTE